MDYWEENGLEKPQQIVVCAACMHKEVVLCGARHWDDVMRAQESSLDINVKASPSRYIQGFIDQFGDFLTREEAMKVVIENEQSTRTLRDHLNPEGGLFSEDLY